MPAGLPMTGIGTAEDYAIILDNVTVSPGDEDPGQSFLGDDAAVVGHP